MKPTIESKSQPRQLRRRTQELADLLSSADRCSENVIVESIVIPELELCNVKWPLGAATLDYCEQPPAFWRGRDWSNRLGG